MPAPNPWSILASDSALWEKDPEEVIQEDRDHSRGFLRLDDALKTRYGSDKRGKLNPRQVGSRFAAELGLGDVKVAPHALDAGYKPFAPGKQAVGRFVPAENRVELLGRGNPDDQADTLVHELAHVADWQKGPGSPEGAIDGSPLHHGHFADFEPEMAQSMDTQAALELGLPVNPAILRRYPWLKGVKPQSSNPLANPWSFYRDPRFTRPGPEDPPPPGPPLRP